MAEKKKRGQMLMIASILGVVLIGVVVTTVVLVARMGKKSEEKTDGGNGGSGNGGDGSTPPPTDNTTTTRYATFRNPTQGGYLSADMNLLVFGKAPQPFQFTLIQGNSNGLYKIMDQAGHYMAEDGTPTGTTKMVSTTTPPLWSIEKQGSVAGNIVAIKSDGGRYLSVQSDGSVQTNRNVASTWEQFDMGESATI